MRERTLSLDRIKHNNVHFKTILAWVELQAGLSVSNLIIGMHFVLKYLQINRKLYVKHERCEWKITSNEMSSTTEEKNEN